MNILEALDHPQIFKSALRNPESWAPWRVFLAALFGLLIEGENLTLFQDCTGRTLAPSGPFNEAWLICGRRAGKSFTMALIAVFLGCFRDYARFLGPGERATIMVIAADRKQARVILRYTRGLLQIPALARMLDRETTEAFDLTNRVTIEVATASYKAVRGYTIVAVLADEISFWSGDGASPDYEILDALRPAMGTIPGAMMICASSPYARRGALWDAHKRYFGRDDAPVLVWKAATRTMNPSFPQAIIDAAMERDSANAQAEFLACFRTDLAAFLTRELVDKSLVLGREELPPLDEYSYVAFADGASGAGADSMTLAIAHRESETFVLDLVLEVRPPFSPDAVVAQFAEICRRYNIFHVTGDRWAPGFQSEAYERHSIQYRVSEKSKSEIYLSVIPLLSSGRVELLDNDRLATQLCSLERRTARGGRDSVDHPPGGHDDLCNAACGALVAAAHVLTLMDVL